MCIYNIEYIYICINIISTRRLVKYTLFYMKIENLSFLFVFV
jgi:hypothetical protein